MQLPTFIGTSLLAAVGFAIVARQASRISALESELFNASLLTKNHLATIASECKAKWVARAERNEAIQEREQARAEITGLEIQKRNDDEEFFEQSDQLATETQARETWQSRAEAAEEEIARRNRLIIGYPIVMGFPHNSTLN